MVDTLNLNENDEGTVSIKNESVENIEIEKNISNNKTMDVTPISDVMQQADMMEPTDPRMVQQQPPMMMQQPMPQMMPQMKKNPMNLTDEQMQAVVVGICAMIAFSKPVQDRLSGFPQFVGENGSRTLIGLGASGLIVSVLFFMYQRYF